jgi:hypothetical protein
MFHTSSSACRPRAPRSAVHAVSPPSPRSRHPRPPPPSPLSTPPLSPIRTPTVLIQRVAPPDTLCRGPRRRLAHRPPTPARCYPSCCALLSLFLPRKEFVFGFNIESASARNSAIQLRNSPARPRRRSSARGAAGGRRAAAPCAAAACAASRAHARRVRRRSRPCAGAAFRVRRLGHAAGARPLTDSE